ncbi:MAG TPA: tRNA 2-thiouridine(34) synthase MnmA, partial [Casimicrobiaceae bacterium]|jgi:tRNA-specific 2-thiouridylase
MALGADAIATGHYARLRPSADGSGRTELLKALDKTKDQSYFLHRLTQAQLAPTIFPLGSMKKSDVRAIAERERIPTWGKKDSTGICFIGERPFRDFLARYLPRTPGPIITPEGRNVGTHSGLAYYTLGQRQGLGVGGQRDADTAPWFVAAKDSARNALIAVQGHDHPLLYRREIQAIDVQWIAGVTPSFPLRAGAKTRYRMADAVCEIRLDNGQARVRFDAPQWAPTPGQYLVIYDGDVCLGGGVITGAPRAEVSPEPTIETAA